MSLIASKVPWDRIKKDYESGIKPPSLSTKYGVARQTIYNRVQAEKWVLGLPLTDCDTRDKISEKLANLVVQKAVKSGKVSKLEDFVSKSIDQTGQLLADVGDTRKVLKEKGELSNPTILRELITAHSAIVKTGREIHGLDRPVNQVNIQFNGIQGAMQQSTIEPEEIESDIIEG